MTFSRLALVPGLLVFASSLFAQSGDETFSSLEERMTGREFSEAGLHKLSPEELAALNEWIRERSVAEYEYEGPNSGPGTGSAESGLPSQPDEVPAIDRMAREAFQSRIKGEFSGWNGNTEFELENGMVWKQDETDRFRIRPVENPVVTIKPGVLGSWFLSVEGHNRSIRVERIE